AAGEGNRNILNIQDGVDAGGTVLSSFTYTATTSGTAYVDISAGGNNPASLTGDYQITFLDDGTDTVLDTASTNAGLTMGGTTTGKVNGTPESGSFNTSLDHDCFAVTLTPRH